MSESTSPRGKGDDFTKEDLEAVASSMWQYRGQSLPDFADKPEEGQESVWLYPRPPAIVAEEQQVKVMLNDEVIADTTAAFRVCETAHPPTYYIPMADVNLSVLEPIKNKHSYCEWKGTASYYRLKGGSSATVAWSYPKPHSSEYADITDTMCFYIDKNGLTATVGDIKARTQGGGFYGGWVLPGFHAGPFKGDPGCPHV